MALGLVKGGQDPSDELIAEARAQANEQLALPGRKHRIYAAKIIKMAEAAVGSFVVRGEDGQLYHFDGMTCRARRVYDGPRLAPEFGALLTSRYNVAPSEDAAKLVAEHICVGAYDQDAKPVKRFSSYDATNNLLYLSRYDGTAWRLDGQKIDVVPNGKDVLFVDDDDGKPCEPEIGPNQGLLDLLVNDLEYMPHTASGLQPEQQQLLLAVWLHAVAFTDAIPGKPTLILVGQAGSGKSLTVKRIQKIVHGEAWISGVAKDSSEEDFAVSLLRRPIASLDNVDSYIDWLGEALAAYATGNGWVRRKRYTDAEQSKISPRSFIAVTTRNPKSFHRDDVADRLIILRLRRRAAFGNEQRILRNLTEQRPQLFGEWLHNLNQIVAVLPQMFEEAQDEAFRLSDFAAFLRVAAKVLGYSDALIADTLERCREEQEELSAEGDHLVELLESYFKNNVPFQGISQTAEGWYTALKTYAALNSTDWSWKSIHQFEVQLQQKWRSIGRRLTTEMEEDARPMRYAFWIKP